jgi:glycosyltransferase involved in cell wall biosynthesis
LETLDILWLNWRDITNPFAGGAELYTHEVAKRLAEQGHEVTLFTSKYPRSKEQENRDGVNIVRRGGTSSVYLRAPQFVRGERLRARRFDVVIDAINTIPFFSQLYARRSLVIGLIYQLTGEIFRKEFPRPVGQLLSGLERSSYLPWYVRRLDRVVVLSDSTRTEILKICPRYEPEKVTVIPPGVDHDKFVPGKKSDAPLILFLNRLVRYKQPEHVIRAMKEVGAHVPSASLVIAGTPTGGRRMAYLRALVNSLGLEGRVSFLLSRPFGLRKISLMQQAWIHVLPSIKEGFGLSILESAACGTPTIGYDAPGIRDAIVSGTTGLLAKRNDVSSLAAGLTDVLADRVKLGILSKQATEWAAKFVWDRTAWDYQSLIKGGNE